MVKPLKQVTMNPTRQLIPAIAHLLRVASSALPEGFEGFDDADLPEPQGPKVRAFEGVKRNAIIAVGHKKWHVLRAVDNYTLYAYAYKTSGKKTYAVYIDSPDGGTASVRQVNGMGARIGPVVVSGRWTLIDKDGGEPLSK